MPLLQLPKTLLDNEQSEDRGADRAEKQRTADEGVFSGRKLRQRISAVRQQDYQSKNRECIYARLVSANVKDQPHVCLARAVRKHGT